LAPPPTGRVGGFLYWLRRDADRWTRENKELVERRFARGPLTRRRRGMGADRRSDSPV